MAISVFELFKIGIGPSSSHTVGPMRAALQFGSGLNDNGLLPKVGTIKVELFGSLGATGKAHGSDKAVVLGLEGEAPESINAKIMPNKLAQIRESGKLSLQGHQDHARDRGGYEKTKYKETARGGLAVNVIEC